MFSFQLEGFPFFPLSTQHSVSLFNWVVKSKIRSRKGKKNPATTLFVSPLLPWGKEFFNVSFFPVGKRSEWWCGWPHKIAAASQRRVANSEVWYIQRHFLPKCNRAVFGAALFFPDIYLFFFGFFYLDPGNGNWWRGPPFYPSFFLSTSPSLLDGPL